MANNDDQLTTVDQENWKAQVYMMGGIAGLIVGLLSAYFYARVSEESGKVPERIKTMDALRLGVALMAIVRQITDLGSKDGDK
ncbi:MAG: hypothetical protein GYB65_08430 [Chloroflexi bacterium]|nr:hypothetical protein [Chloroflexota bacterium]